MTKIQVLLPDGQIEKLNYLAKRMKTTKSRLIREAIDKILIEKTSDAADPLLDLIGQAGEAGRFDISGSHNGVLIQEEQKRWRERGSL